MTDPPDFPRRDPTPSMAALPFNFDSVLSGMKEISFVASKNVYFEARHRQFCIDPNKAHIIRGVDPPRTATHVRLEFCRRTKTRNPTRVSNMMIGGMRALVVQETRRMTLPVMNIAVVVAIMPIARITSPIYTLYSLGLG